MADENLDVKSLLRVYIKVGDKKCAAGKEAIALRHGMVVSWQRIERAVLTGRQVSGREPGIMDRVAFAIVELDDTPANEQRLRWACEAHEVADKDGKVDLQKSRSRKGFCDLEAVAELCGGGALCADWQAKGKAVEPKYASGWDAESDVRDATTAEFVPMGIDGTGKAGRVEDVNAVSAGSYTVGSGGSYSTWANAFADIANLTGDLTFTQIADTTETSSPTITEDLGGFTLTCTVGDTTWHSGNAARGLRINIGHNANLFNVQCEGPGTMVIQRLYMVRTVAGSSTAQSAVYCQTVSTAFNFTIRQCMINGGGLAGSGIFAWSNTPVWSVYANRVRGCSTGISMSIAGTDDTVEDCTVYQCTTGIDAANRVFTCRRNACYANTTDFANTANATGHSNASDDATAADANWAAGSSGNLSARTPATDFDSLTVDSPAFMRPVYGGGLQSPAVTTRLAANATDLSGRAWATYGAWIGCRVGLPAPTLPAGSGYRVSGSTVAVPIRRVFEAAHADDTNVPLILSEGSADFGGAADPWWSTVGVAGADVVASSTAGVAYPTRVLYLDKAARKMLVAVKLPTLDADADVDLLLQCGGTGPASTAVFAGCYAGGFNYNLVWPLKEAAGDALDHSGNGYHGTVAASLSRAGASKLCGGLAFDFEAANAADVVSNAAAMNVEYTQPLTHLAWVKRESTGGTSMCVLSRFEPTTTVRGGVLQFTSGNNLLMQEAASGAAYWRGQTGVNTSTAWQMLAWAYNGSGEATDLRAHVDAARVSLSVTNGLGGNSILTAAPFNVGAINGGSNWFDGLIDYVRVVLGALSAAQVATHYSDEVDAANNGAYVVGVASNIPTNRKKSVQVM